MSRLYFEWVGDINETYSYMCVYFKKANALLGKENDPFMDIGINEEKELVFMLYASTKDVKLSLDEWKEIQLKAEAFLPKELRKEEEYQAWQQEQEQS